MRKTFAVLAIATGLVSLLASDAMARGDGWDPTPGAPFVLPSSLCGFPVRVAYPVNQEYTKTVSQTSSTLVLRITGRLVQRFTNLESGTSITANVSGPLTVVIDLQSGVANVDGQGRSSFFFLPQDQTQFGVPGIMFISGHLRETLDTTTNDVSTLSISGETQDACRQLA